jgi:hypothetical protein
MQVSDDLFLGPAYAGANAPGNTSINSMEELGCGPMGRVYLFDVVPLVLQLAGLASGTQNPASGASFVLSAGTGVTSAIDATGVTRYTLDVPRSVTITATGANTATYTVTGYDQYGQKMSQLLAAPTTSTVSTTKMFKQVISVTNANATAGTNNLTVGYGDSIGLPFRLLTKDYIIPANFNATALALSTFTAADTTSPATVSTSDVRGSVALPSASDGTKRLVVCMGLPGIACGPNATRIGAFGVTQV